MIERITDQTATSFTYKGERLPSGISTADKYCVGIKILPERLWRVDYYNPNTPNHPSKVGISAHDTTSAFPDTEEKFEAKILQLLSDQQKGPISRLSGKPKSKSGFIAFWNTPRAAEDALKLWELDRKGEEGQWCRTMIETAKMESEKVSPLETVLELLPTDDRTRREAIPKEQYEGIFLVWHGVKMEAVAEQVVIGEQRLWELGLCQESFNAVTEGIRLGALNAIQKVGGVVALKDFGKDFGRKTAKRIDGTRPKAATTVGSKVRAAAKGATKDQSGKDARLGLDGNTCLVEEVLAHRPPAAGSCDKVKDYLIKWEGDDEYTWEPKDSASIGGIEPAALGEYWARLERVRMGRAAAK
jgi:hypothetical protein